MKNKIRIFIAFHRNYRISKSDGCGLVIWIHASPSKLPLRNRCFFFATNIAVLLLNCHFNCDEQTYKLIKTIFCHFRINWYQLLKIVQKCGQIEKFDMIFHKSGPMVGQARGYAFVTYQDVSVASTIFGFVLNEFQGVCLCFFFSIEFRSNNGIIQAEWYISGDKKYRCSSGKKYQLCEFLRRSIKMMIIYLNKI